MKYEKTKYPNIFTYETMKGKRYFIRRGYKLHGKKKEATKSNIKTLAEARAALAEIERKIDNNEFTVNKNLTVDQYWNIYHDNRIRTGKWAPDTEATKMTVYNYHFKEQFGHIKLKNVSRIDYENFINDKLKTHSKSTVVQMHGLLNAMFNHALHNKYIDDNQIDKIDIGNSNIKPKNKRVSLTEFKLWDKTAREILGKYEYTMVRVTYFGLRKSEAAGIQIGRMTLLENGRYQIELKESRTRCRKDGGAMKTDDSERYVVFDLETSVLLADALQRTQAIAKKYGIILGPKDFLFRIDYDRAWEYLKGKPIRTEYIYELFEKVDKACGLHVTPHMMRHFFTTQGQIAGVPVEHMASALGHSTSYMTQKYTHIKEEVASSVTDSFMSAIT